MKTGRFLIVLLLTMVMGIVLGGMARAQSARDYHERGLAAGEKGKYDQTIAD